MECAVHTDASWVQGMCKCKGKAKSKMARKERKKEGGSQSPECSSVH